MLVDRLMEKAGRMLRGYADALAQAAGDPDAIAASPVANEDSAAQVAEFAAKLGAVGMKLEDRTSSKHDAQPKSERKS